MHATRRFLFLLVSAGVLSACGGSTEPSYTAPANQQQPATPPTGGGGSTSSSVQVVDNSFSPDSTTLSLGTTVTWTWGAVYTAHNVTFSDGPSSGNMTAGTYSRTFNTAGKYVYTCTNHAGMRGVVVIQ